jgi:tripartite-type tricarboxylate transporter receptor subunit TctC
LTLRPTVTSENTEEAAARTGSSREGLVTVVARAAVTWAAVACFATLAAMFAGTASAAAQTYPSRPITMIVPFPPGGATDAIARIISERLRAALGQPVIIENVGGAGGSIGVGRAVRAAPDGYTLNLGQLGLHVMNGAAYDLSKMIC